MTDLLFDFSDPAAAAAWRSIDDRVMGGVSQSRLRADPAGHAVFEGRVSLDRGGGFASVRSSPAALGRPGAVRCELEVRGEARTYKLGLLTDDAFDGLVYQVAFVASPDGWQNFKLPLADFCPTFRGRTVDGAPLLDPGRIRQIGLTIAARQAGPFRLDIRRIALK